MLNLFFELCLRTCGTRCRGFPNPLRCWQIRGCASYPFRFLLYRSQEDVQLPCGKFCATCVLWGIMLVQNDGGRGGIY
ncbi:hypothetical protein ABL78_4358 [Leptomonas seymouri]|uniref:Uncharacterized protein n=1 Tax=Leptomonas seymouri TaxID=5684 RepID=A0A0N1PB84_LEPSE|nr:hypothetical protein ABL78_4358 [Leptomonas seymouri]|eukprot:KPI86583.1 hypothetical protein ABL78_4358 [Leptomonas seymouri]